jgi:hypothetical protein
MDAAHTYWLDRHRTHHASLMGSGQWYIWRHDGDEVVDTGVTKPALVACRRWMHAKLVDERAANPGQEDA